MSSAAFFITESMAQEPQPVVNAKEHSTSMNWDAKSLREFTVPPLAAGARAGRYSTTANT